MSYQTQVLPRAKAQKKVQAVSGSSLSAPRISAEWLAYHARPDYTVSNTVWEGKAINYPPFMETLGYLFATKGIGDLLLPEVDRPIIPDKYVPAVVNENPPPGQPLIFVPLTAEQRQFNLKVDEALQKRRNQYQQGLSIVLSKLGTRPRSLVSHHVRAQIAAVEKFNNIMTTLQDNYGQNSDVTVMEMERVLDLCPMVNTYDEAELLMALITDIGMDMNSLGQDRVLSESNRRILCLKKLGPHFKELVRRVEGNSTNNALTFAQVCTEITRLRDIDRVCETAVVRAPAESEFMDDTSNNGASSSLVNVSTVFNGNRKGACLNCGRTNHYIRECLAMCARCPGKGYHPHSVWDCPDQPFSPNNQRRNNHGGRSGGRNNRRSQGPPQNQANIYQDVMNKQTGSVSGIKRQVNEISQNDDRDRGYQDDEDDDENEYLPGTSSSTMFQVNMIQCSNSDQEDAYDMAYNNGADDVLRKSAEGCRSSHPDPLVTGMLDTGANVPITHPRLADILQISPQLWETPVPIQFGNSSDCVSTHYIYLGALIGKVALVESAKSTILTKNRLHNNGVAIVFKSSKVCQLVLDASGHVLYEQALAHSEDFFMIPLQILLPPELKKNLDDYLLQYQVDPDIVRNNVTSHIREVNGRRFIPVTAEEVSAVMSLHDRMYHPSSAVMASALRTGAWTGVDVSPQLVERVFRRRGCLSCAVGKMKRIPQGLGSAVTPPFGQEISVDYLPINTEAKGGFNGAYIFVERSAGYAWAYLTPVHNHHRLLKAVDHVRSCLNRRKFTWTDLRTDAGRVEISHDLAVKLAERGITVNSATPCAQYQNFVERFIQTAIRGVASTLVAQKILDNSFWGMALLAWIRSWNCRPNTNSGEYTPEYIYSGRHPDVGVQFKFPFGAPVVSRILPAKNSNKSTVNKKFKFGPTGELGYVVGNTESSNGASLVFFYC